MKRTLFSVVFFWCLLFSVNAQKVKFTGVASDSSGVPLELANVVAVHKKSGVIESYGVTDYLGRFVLDVNADSTYILRCSYVGYEDYEKELVASKNPEPFNLIMQESETQLNAIEIVEEFPVVITDDTITYKTDAFTDGNERKLEDVLEDLPGFEVSEDGQIKVQGKQVEKVLVEGKEFFDGDTKMASQNIPANAVEKVQVLRNYNDVSQMRGLGDEDRIALNIKLKEGKKNMTFGDIEAGFGLESRYLAHANLFYYSPKLTLNFIGDGNNIGKPAFTIRDYFRFTGGFSSLSNRNGSNFSISTGDLGIQTANSRNSVDVGSQLGALNFNYTPNEKIAISGFYIGSATKSFVQNQTLRTFVKSDNDSFEVLENENENSLFSNLAKFTLKYTPSEKWFLSSQSFLKFSSTKQDLVQQSDFNEIQNENFSTTTQDPVDFTQQFSAYYSGNDQNVFSLESKFTYQEQDPVFNFLSTQPIFESIIPYTSIDSVSLNQSTLTSTLSNENLFTYYRVLNRTNHLSFDAGANLLSQSLNSNLLESGTEVFINDQTYFLQDYFLGVGYKTKLGDLILNPKIHYHTYHLDAGFETDYKTGFWSPSLYAEYDLNASQTLIFNYNLSARFNDINSYNNEFILKSYNSIFIGNPILENGIYHNASLSYRNWSMFSFVNIFGTLNYSRQMNDFGNLISFDQQGRISTVTNLSQPNQVISGNLNFSKSFIKFKIRAGLNANLSSIYSEVESENVENKSFTRSGNISFRTTLMKMIYLELGYRKIYNDYSGNQTNSTFENDIPFGNVEIEITKSFSLIADYEFNYYRSQSGLTSSKYDFLDMTLQYQKEDAPWTVRLSGTNLLDTEFIRQDSFSESLISTYSVFVQPRYFTLSVMYEL